MEMNMLAKRIATAVAMGITAATLHGTPASAAMSTTNCSDDTAIHVNVPYYPNTYCYKGTGSRTVNLTQVYSVEARNWTVTVLWKPPGGTWRHSTLTSGKVLYTQSGTVDTISSP
ncbi:hypothetical protein ACIA59_33330 [Micromonospora haikouensis]|uniref:hypothetical protein n=1 Tax=Micromonospora haikouensis TaxID=686309 RepID=UPI0037998A9B